MGCPWGFIRGAPYTSRRRSRTLVTRARVGGFQAVVATPPPYPPGLVSISSPGARGERSQQRDRRAACLLAKRPGARRGSRQGGAALSARRAEQLRRLAGGPAENRP